MRALNRDINGKQGGDPYKAGRAIDIALAGEITPLRLQVGPDSSAAVRGHAEQLLRDLAAWEQVGADTQIDAVAQ